MEGSKASAAKVPHLSICEHLLWPQFWQRIQGAAAGPHTSLGPSKPALSSYQAVSSRLWS